MTFKIIVVTGGVMSGIGKGHVAASIARILKWHGLKVAMIKIDPYLNTDAGTMSPFEHGENFVCEDVWEFEPVPGWKFRIAETDQDLGTYERFTGDFVHPSFNITSGQVYLSVILKERHGEYLGKTVQMIPHVTDEIKRRIMDVAKRTKCDVLIIEVGGTVGDIEGMIFLEALRQLRLEIGPENFMLVHVTYLPYLPTTGELKTKPTQHSVQRLLQAGLVPDVIICRAERDVDEKTRKKIALYSNVSPDAVISNPNVDFVYEIPLLFMKQKLNELILKRLQFKDPKIDQESIKMWTDLINKYKNAKDVIKIALVGKYVAHKDAYISIREALLHAGVHLSVKVKTELVDAENLNEEELLSFDGILLTPGFGERAAEGMIRAAEIALEKKIPFLGICFGCQLGTVAFARRIMGWKKANTTEVDPSTPYPVVDLLPEQKKIKEKGGTMRLGALDIMVVEGTKLWQAYKRKIIRERFRHRYHIIEKYVKDMEKKGYIVNSYTRDRKIAGFEISWHPFFVGVQFHPEFKSRLWQPSPIYLAFLEAALEFRKSKIL